MQRNPRKSDVTTLKQIREGVPQTQRVPMTKQTHSHSPKYLPLFYLEKLLKRNVKIALSMTYQKKKIALPMKMYKHSRIIQKQDP